MQFYYHPDHLGSSNYITDASGEVYQHEEYFPFGETFVEERNDAEYTTYLFNGKELDEETGLYYYGARYYDPRISIFYGVDPLVEKYAFQSPYCYAANNPILFIEINGKGPGWNRLIGGLQMVGGFVEAVVGGVGGVVTSETGAGAVVGYVVLANGCDNMTTGFKQLWTGKEETTLLHQGVKTSATALGASENTAENIATGVDLSTIFLGGANSVKTIKSFNAVTKDLSIENKISRFAKDAGIFSGQKSLNNKEGVQIVEKYFNQMVSGKFNRGAAGFITKEGKYVITDGNHAMNAAIKYALEKGDSKYIKMLIEKGNFKNVEKLSDYGIKLYDLPTK